MVYRSRRLYNVPLPVLYSPISRRFCRAVKFVLEYSQSYPYRKLLKGIVYASMEFGITQVYAPPVYREFTCQISFIGTVREYGCLEDARSTSPKECIVFLIYGKGCVCQRAYVGTCLRKSFT